MAVSNSFDFTLDRDGLINEALENIGVKDPQESVDPAIIQTSNNTFNLMLKSLQRKGLFIWTWREASLPLVAATQSYTLGPSGTATDVLLSTAIQNPLEISDVRLRDTSGVERPCSIISIAEYHNYINKADTGEIVNVAFLPGTANATLFVWPVNTSVTDVLRFQYKKPFDDMDARTNNLCFPTDYMDYIVLALTARLAAKFQKPLNEQTLWAQRAADAFEALDDFEMSTSFFIQPRFK